jgi:signal transduction histidine kinase
VFVCLAFLFLVVFVLTRQTWQLLTIAAAFLALPIVEVNSGIVFQYLFTGTILFFLARSVGICVMKLRELRTNLSALSVKAAIDSLHTGVLFGEMDGYTLLSNTQMQQLMVVTTGKISRDCNRFYEALQSGDVQSCCQKKALEKQFVYLLPDNSAWMFTKTELFIKGKRYMQLTASDITERWALTEQLYQQEDVLKQTSEEIKETIANLHILSNEMETQKAKLRAHDILGERLTVLLRAIRNERTFDSHLLYSLSYRLIEELKNVNNTPSPQEALENLRQVFDSIGVRIEVNGGLPSKHTKALLFFEIIREAVSNAVRHGFATRVDIQIDYSDDGYLLEISDNGYPASSDIEEGGGINGIRSRLEPFGGILTLTSHPPFTLAVYLPGCEDGEKPNTSD